MNLWIFCSYFVGYFALHSILADNRVKEKLYPIIPIQFYRLIYNLLAVVLFVLLLKIFRQLPVNYLFAPIPIVGNVLMIFGGILLLWSLRNYHLGEFSGTYQVTHQGKTPNHPLNTKGLNAYVRHPLYTASFLLFWGFFLAFPAVKTLCFSGIASAYLVIGTELEERKLVAVFGEEYLAYQERVGRFLPKIIRTNKY